MKKTIKNNVKNRYLQWNEDMRILQRMVTKKSVYAKARVNSVDYQRRPKHSKRYFYQYEQYC
ncbi:MAG: hypothetical protein MUF85_01845 [Patescibacteria group bacterium]|jgi:hypothetical protein|nr:hypothetical protein [Patescibacteria group bacterium]